MSQKERTNWKLRAAGGYEKLGWVSANNLLDHIVELAEIDGNETVVDVGTGSQAILKTLSPHLTRGGRAIGFDLSLDMLKGQDTRSENNLLFLADAKKIPLPTASADLVTSRMVLHHIPEEDLLMVLSEMKRVTKPGGKIIVCEYVAHDDEVWEFEREVFNIKEPERHLWTGFQLKDLVELGLNGNSHDYEGRLSYAILPQYSVKDWMGKSGLPDLKQRAVLERYLFAPLGVQEKMGINYTEDGDALVDRLFAYVTASTNHRQ